MHQIRREKRTTISEVIVSAVSEKLSKIGIGFISNFLLKARALFYRLVCHLFGFTRMSFCQNLLGQ